MKNATVLVVVGKSAKPADLEQLSEAARERNLHLSVLILGLMPTIPVYSYGYGGFGGYAIPEGWDAMVEETNAQLEASRDRLSQYLANQAASADVRVISGEVAAMPDAVTRSALTCDIVMLGNDLRKDGFLFTDTLHATLFRSPAAVVVNGMTNPRVLQPKSVFVAWKAGVPASRAVHAALPLLREADTVTIGLFDPTSTETQDGENPGSDIAEWLTHQGCNVTVVPYPSGGAETGTAIRKRATEIGADLIVMGAYGHSRLREVVFGGTTESMVEQRDCAVLFGH